MLRAVCRTAMFAVLVAPCIVAGDDPLIGTWKYNPAKSKTYGQNLKIEDLGANKYRITGLMGLGAYEVVADGTDQPRAAGGTRSLTVVNATNWKSLLKQDGVVFSETTWAVSSDGRTITTHMTLTNPDGTTREIPSVNTLVSGAGGFVGTWEDKNFKHPSRIMEIRPYAGGVSFFVPADKTHLDLKFEGKDYAEKGPRADQSMVSSGKRLSSGRMQIIEKYGGKVRYTDEYQVSPDGKTLTITSKTDGQPQPGLRPPVKSDACNEEAFYENL